MRSIVTDTHARRLTAQLLAGPPALDPPEVVRQLLAVQGQDPRGFRLAVRSRTDGLVAADVDRCLDDGSLVVSWLNRGTLHLVQSEDLRWLAALTTPRLHTSAAGRLARLGVSPTETDRAVAVIDAALAESGPLTRKELRVRLDAAGIRTAGQTLIHLLFTAAIRGIAVRGPLRGREQAYVRVGDWIDAQPAIDPDSALSELARRYLTGHGPADDRDLARWAGITLGNARAALSSISGELQEHDGGLVSLRDAPAPAPTPRPRLLGAFDPLLLGWRDRTPVVGEHRRLVTDQGLFRPFALVRGRAGATWGMRGGAVEIQPFAPLSRSVERRLEAEAADVRRYLLAAGPGSA